MCGTAAPGSRVRSDGLRAAPDRAAGGLVGRHQAPAGAGAFRGNRWLTDASQLQHGDTVVSILHVVHGGQTRSRLQVTVRADRTGLGLYESLRVWLSLFDIVLQWKVLNPQAGATGPQRGRFTEPISRRRRHADARQLARGKSARN